MTNCPTCGRISARLVAVEGMGRHWFLSAGPPCVDAGVTVDFPEWDEDAQVFKIRYSVRYAMAPVCDYEVMAEDLVFCFVRAQTGHPGGIAGDHREHE